MTREEAIKRIQDHMEVHHIGEYPHIHIKEALDIAIAALREQEERENQKAGCIAEAIETIQDMLDVLETAGSCYMYKHNGGSDRLQNVLACLCAKQEERRWIPVTERLPDADGTYLCVWQRRKVDTGFFINGQFRLYGEVKTHLISHWMPMPELPKEDAR